MVKLTPRAAAFAAACLASIKAKNPTPPILTPAIDFFDGRKIQIMRTRTNGANQNSNSIAHFPTSQERKDALNIIRWTLAVAGIYADSPRFAYYVSRWDVPNKIRRAIADGTFDDTVANCPPIDPAWVRFVPGALEAHRQFIAPKTKTITEQRKSSDKTTRAV